MDRASLERAYRATAYRVGRLELRVGEPAPALDALLAARGLDEWAWLTAWNPGSRRLPEEENRARQRELISQLISYQWLRGEAVADAGDWPAEPGALVLGLPRAEAEALGRAFGQAAILAGRRGGPAELAWLV